ncbi:hypothetical protein [Vibrio alginolyticus]|uniref:hypothetical protein n=1 Tax=Vibrio TaxID=662 RepID=UPI0006CA6A2D|nr:hypothetical protein [Vibrio alginolyticus]KPM98617.1 hypothetical protein AOG25_09280 [Vibrio alginolyticus]CAH7160954.1 conserved hypothetical protein [Vibrio chagasii]CAH7330206.1 conserved hypothetical protein [Vibrio chagasii]
MNLSLINHSRRQFSLIIFPDNKQTLSIAKWVASVVGSIVCFTTLIADPLAIATVTYLKSIL